MFSSLLARVTKPRERQQTGDGANLVPTNTARNADPWFWSHFDDVAKIVLSIVPSEALGSGKKIVDFGCGDGAATLGVASRVKAEVTGVDLHEVFQQLPALAEKNLGSGKLPVNLSFKTTKIGDKLPFADGSVDLSYSWSVFEHVADVGGCLGELSRIAKRGAYTFLQIEPLFYSPFGSHLRRLVDEPWAHLLYPESEYLQMAASAKDHVLPAEQDGLYKMNAFEDVKRYLVDE